MKRVAILGGAGYVGSALTPYLLSLGYQIKVIDLFFYDDRVFENLSTHPSLSLVRADIRNVEMLEQELAGMDAVIHLACISNDPCFELDPHLGKSVNFDAFFGILHAVGKNEIKRLIYASSSSVYGVSSDPNVDENAPCRPLTDYSTYKLRCEEVLKQQLPEGVEFVILRPATVCGYAPRLRLDLIVNLLTIQAIIQKRIVVHGGSQLRPNIHIRDMIESYRRLLEAPAEKVHGETFNVGYENKSVSEIAELIRDEIGAADVCIETKPVVDPRSYHIHSEKISLRLGFRPRHTLREAIQSISEVYREGCITDPLNDSRYYNIKRMQETKFPEYTCVS